jgi:adenylate cyclase
MVFTVGESSGCSSSAVPCRSARIEGDLDEARAALAELLKLKPESNSLARLRATAPNWNASPQFVALREKTVDVGLRRAGLPDE